MESVMKIPLEDLFEDIVGKAQRGLGVDDDQLVAKLGTSIEALRELKRGSSESKLVPQVAQVLHLGASALNESHRQVWFPEKVPTVDGVAQFNTELLGMTVNSYLIWEPKTKKAAIFDTGADARKMLDFIKTEKIQVESVFITHTHDDHIACLADLLRATTATLYAPALECLPEAKPVKEGDRFQVGGLKVEVRLTNGHSPGGTSYIVHGLSVPVVVVGDSLFAGSMGGAQNDYAGALRNNREKILSLPGETLVCPGHGPMTTVENERKHNPFFAT
jgi:hydroxyacylglutathione hydrolase